MTRKLYVRTGDITEIAVTEDGHLVEYVIDDPAMTQTDAIILGRVERVVTGMDAAFVDIGEEKNGFLPLTEKSASFTQSRLQAGMGVLVQLKRAAHGTKGAFLSRDLTLCGKYLILMPLNRYIGISEKIRSDTRRAELKELGGRLTGGGYGLVFRTAANEAQEEEISLEYKQLIADWQGVLDAAPTAHMPGVLYSAGGEMNAILRDYARLGFDEMIAESEAAATLLPHGAQPVILPDAFLRDRITRQRDIALGRTVLMENGGSLIIDACEALTVIDVNSGSFTGKGNAEDTFLRTNLEACEEIAAQLRLRNVGGIVIIDFIDLKSPEDREQVTAALRQALRNDRCKSVLHGFTTLGLMEITRKRSRATLHETMVNFKKLSAHHDGQPDIGGKL